MFLLMNDNLKICLENFLGLLNTYVSSKKGKFLFFV